MGTRIEVVLLEDIDSLGQAGTVVVVSEGYARNFLFPQGKAALASPAVKARQEQVDQKRRAAEAAQLAEAQKLAETIDGKELTLTARVKEGSELYARLTARDVARELKAQTKINVTAKQIHLSSPITEVGSRDVTIEVGDGVTAIVHVTVVAAARDQKADAK